MFTPTGARRSRTRSRWRPRSPPPCTGDRRTMGAHFAQGRDHLHRAHEPIFALRDMTLRLLRGPLCPGGFLDHAEDCRLATVGRPNALQFKLDDRAVFAHGGESVAGGPWFLLNQTAQCAGRRRNVLLDRETTRVLAGHLGFRGVAENLDEAGIAIGKPLVLNDEYPGE